MTAVPRTPAPSDHDADETRDAYYEAVDAWQEVQSRRHFPQWQLMTNVVAPAQAHIATLEAQNAAIQATVDEQAAALEQITDIAVIALNDVWVNSGRDGINAWYLTHTREAHQAIAKLLKRDMYDLFYEAVARLAAPLIAENKAASADADTPTGGG